MHVGPSETDSSSSILGSNMGEAFGIILTIPMIVADENGTARKKVLSVFEHARSHEMYNHQLLWIVGRI